MIVSVVEVKVYNATKRLENVCAIKILLEKSVTGARMDTMGILNVKVTF